MYVYICIYIYACAVVSKFGCVRCLPPDAIRKLLFFESESSLALPLASASCIKVFSPCFFFSVAVLARSSSSV